MKFSMLRKELKAVSRFATVKDIRHYLNGVHIVQNNRGTYLEATNGHMAARFLILDQPMPCASIILGNDAIKTLTAAGKKGDEWLHFTVEGLSIEVITGSDKYTFTAVEGNFPDIDRIVPPVLKAEDESPAGFNPAYLMAFQDAANDIRGNKKGAVSTVSVLHRGNSAAIVNNGIDNFFGVIMPLRDMNRATVPNWNYKPKTLEDSPVVENQSVAA
jgi:DNA polymerase-3 subunit beta